MRKPRNSAFGCARVIPAAAVLLMWFTTQSALAECWTASNFKGVVARKAEGYRLEADAFSSSDGSALTIVLQANSTATEVTGWDSGRCKALGPGEIQCLGQSTMDLWRVDEQTRTVLLSRYRRGAGPFDGATLMVGVISGRCE